jgi:DNA-directed RNA polymerase specialized sigma24 family protein
MDDPAIEKELVAAQAAVDSARQARVRRQEIVMKARAAGWSKYRIAAVLGVKAPTVDSIIKAANNEGTDNA